MDMTDRNLHLRALLERLARVSAAEAWDAGLNPAQGAALAYLARANRFSRAPSQVADYLGATRGTVSQTLKALQRKGLIREEPDGADGRRIAYHLTDEGRAALAAQRLPEGVLEGLAPADAEALERGATALLRGLLAARGGRSFGLCRTCRHHRAWSPAPRCALLKIDLAPDEAEQICHEHAPA
jgi:DNA-binding MarR family transcriptional regulator